MARGDAGSPGDGGLAAPRIVAIAAHLGAQRTEEVASSGPQLALVHQVHRYQ